jgi:hypothetical protein
MLHTTEHQERGMHCGLWVQQLASSKSFKKESTIICYLQWKKYASFAKLLKGTTKKQISCCRSGKVVLQPLHASPQRFKQLYEDPLFLIMVRSYNSNFAFASTGASPAEDVQVEQLANARDGVYTCRVQETICHRVSILPSTESRTSGFALCTFSIVIPKHT